MINNVRRKQVYSSDQKMFRMVSIFVLLAVLLIVNVQGADKAVGIKLPGSDIQSVAGKSLLKTGKFGSKLYSLDTPNAIYEDAIMVLDLRGPNSFSQGFDTGFLLGKEFLENYYKLIVTLLGA